MGRPTGRPPKPAEVKRRLGNPGHGPLPKPGTVIAMPAAEEPPDPSRPLGPAGRALWDRMWSSSARHWLAPTVDSEALLLLCEQMDERQAPRVRVLRDANWRDRRGLRALDYQVASNLGLLGLNPVDRSRLGVAEVMKRDSSALDEIMARRRTR